MSLMSIAWVVTFLCVLFSARIATAFLRHNPDMFTVMALLACTWTLVLGFYGAPGERTMAQLVSDVAAFLLLYIGALLMVHARADLETKTIPLQSVGLLLLVVVALPKEFSLTTPGGNTFGFSLNQSKAFISFGLDVASWIAIAFGAKAISSRRLFALLAIILALYIVLDAYHYYGRITDGMAQSQLTSFEYGAYAALKAAFTITFGCIVAYHGMSKEDRAKGPIYWVLHFFYLAGRASNEQPNHRAPRHGQDDPRTS